MGVEIATNTASVSAIKDISEGTVLCVSAQCLALGATSPMQSTKHMRLPSAVHVGHVTARKAHVRVCRVLVAPLASA